MSLLNRLTTLCHVTIVKSSIQYYLMIE